MMTDGDRYIPNWQVGGRGIIDKAGRIQERCSLKYLHALYMELSRARSYKFGSNRNNSAVQRQVQRLEFLTHELDRLCEHPTLFPSRSVQLRFMTISFDYESDYSFAEACKILLVQKRLLSIQQRSHKLVHVHTVHYSSAHGWESFLLPAKSSRDLLIGRERKDCSLQLLPAVGVRICGDLAREEVFVSDHKQEPAQVCSRDVRGSTEKIKRRCCASETCEDNCRTSMFRDGRRHALNTVEKPCANNLAQRKLQGVALCPSPFDLNRKLRIYDAMCQGVTPIETFSSIIHRLELLAPRHFVSSMALNTPNTLAVVSVKSYNKSTRLCRHTCCTDTIAAPNRGPTTFTGIEC